MSFRFAALLCVLVPSFFLLEVTFWRVLVESFLGDDPSSAILVVIASVLCFMAFVVALGAFREEIRWKKKFELLEDEARNARREHLKEGTTLWAEMRKAKMDALREWSFRKKAEEEAAFWKQAYENLRPASEKSDESKVGGS